MTDIAGFDYLSSRGSAWEAMPDAPRRWQLDAACAGEDVGMFYDPTRYPQARALCESCPVRVACLDDAYVTGDYEGFRGGLAPRTREDRAKGRSVTRKCRRCAASFIVPLRSQRVLCGPTCQSGAKADAQKRYRQPTPDGVFRPQYPGEAEAIANGVLGVLSILGSGR